MPVLLVVTGVLAIVDGSDLEDLVPGGGVVLAVAAQGGAAPLVDLGGVGSGPDLLRLGEGVGGDRAERQESHGSLARRRHVPSDGDEV